ncbi:MAG: LysM peptidoglycan-binding domain-containing protein [Caldilineaceae bacterium]
MIAHYGGSEAYSYVYDGQLGYLDHALASSTLVSQTTGAMDWHINADEAKVLDYDSQFNPPQYYIADPFRASDHDPVLVGLALTGDVGDGGDPGAGEPLENRELIHVVLPGESLSSIARRYSVMVSALAVTNALGPWSPIYSNQQLVVPPVAADVTCVRTIYSEPGESFVELAERFGADAVRLAIANGLLTIAGSIAEQPICLPSIY